MRTMALVIATMIGSVGAARAQDAPPAMGHVERSIGSPATRIDFSTEELARAGERDKKAGVALMAIGGSFVALGVGIMAIGYEFANNPHVCGGANCDGKVYVADFQGGVQTAGLVTALVGTVLAVVGGPLYARGGARMERARRVMRALDVSARGARLTFQF